MVLGTKSIKTKQSFNTFFHFILWQTAQEMVKNKISLLSFSNNEPHSWQSIVYITKGIRDLLCNLVIIYTRSHFGKKISICQPWKKLFHRLGLFKKLSTSIFFIFQETFQKKKGSNIKAYWSVNLPHPSRYILGHIPPLSGQFTEIPPPNSEKCRLAIPFWWNCWKSPYWILFVMIYTRLARCSKTHIHKFPEKYPLLVLL